MVKKKREIEHQGLHCLVCEDDIFSEYGHDFRECTCGNCFVDGGKNYFRAGFFDDAYIETAIRFTDGSIEHRPFI